MSCDTKPYPFRWLGHKTQGGGPSFLLRTHTYEFCSGKSGLRYIALAEEFSGELYAVKFYCAKHKGCGEKLRYRLCVDTFDTMGVSSTMVAIVLDLLSRYPGASFGMLASRSIDPTRDESEPRPTKRFGVWCGVIQRTMGVHPFEHYRFNPENGYMLINKCHGDCDAKKEEYRKMISASYDIVPGV